MAYNDQTVAPNATAQPSSFDKILGELYRVGGGIAVGVLQAKGESALAREQAKRDIAVQDYYNQLGRQNPAYGPNEPVDAKREAESQTGLLKGFQLSGNNGVVTLGMLGLIAVVFLALFFKGK